MTEGSARRSGLAAAALVYTAVAIAFTWPLALGIDRDVPGDLGDSLLNMWILAWGAEHIPRLVYGATTWTEYWQGNIFHPAPLTLALSEHLFAQSVQIAPLYLLSGNILLCYNLLFLSTFVLSALGMFGLVRDLTGDWRAGAVAGLVFGFLPYRVAQVPHLQVLSAQWMPFVLWGLHRFAAERSWRALAGATAALAAQNWSCGYYLLYFAPFVPLFAAHELWRARRFGDRGAWTGLLAAAAVVALMTLPFLLPYLQVREVHGLERPFAEIRGFSANVWSYLTAPTTAWLWRDTLRFYDRPEGETFLGVTAMVLAVAALLSAVAGARRDAADLPRSSGWRRMLGQLIGLFLIVQGAALLLLLVSGRFRLRLGGVTVSASAPLPLLAQLTAAVGLLLALSPRLRRVAATSLRQPAVAAVLLALLAAWLSLGPEPAAGPSPLPGFGLYRVLYDYVPGFTGVRVPARFAMVAGLFVAIAAGAGVAAPARLTRGRAWLPMAALLVMADAWSAPLVLNATWSSGPGTPPARIHPAHQAPAVYRQLASLPSGTVIAELPLGEPEWELRAVYYATVHRHPVLNGYSGAFPSAYSRRVAELRRFETDGDAAWEALVQPGTTHVVVRTQAIADQDEARTLTRWLETRGAKRLESFPDGEILFALR